MKTTRSLPMAEPGRWLVVVLFGVAMAWVESSVVFYLRTMINRVEPYQVNPLPQFTGFARAELIREAATLVMLTCAGWLAGRDRRSRFAYGLVAFGVWDIFYYVFLKVLTDWPRSILDWDILFLIPLPWWGPVWAPVSIAGLMLFWGTLATQFPEPVAERRNSWSAWALSVLGVFLALYVFMEDALRVASSGPEAVRNLLPEKFNWLMFSLAFSLMAAPVICLARDVTVGRLVAVPNSRDA